MRPKRIFLIVAGMGVVLLATCICISLTQPSVLSQSYQESERKRYDHDPIQLSSGSQVVFGNFSSPSLNSNSEYSIYLPPSYQNGKKHYPVVYFLHGLNNDHTSWTVDRYGQIHQKVDHLILDKKVPEILMVHPKGDNSFYTNYLDGSKRYEDFITQDLIQYVEKNYRAKPGPKWRAIGGTSMGGFGALKIAFKHKEMYTATAAHSPIIFLNDPERMSEETKNSGRFGWFTQMIAPIFGNPVNLAKWRNNNPLDLAKTADLAGLGIYFDYGTADRYNASVGLGEGLKKLDEVLNQRHISHIFREYPDEPHGWELVSHHIAQSLPFLCQNFHE